MFSGTSQKISEGNTFRRKKKRRSRLSLAIHHVPITSLMLGSFSVVTIFMTVFIIGIVHYDTRQNTFSAVQEGNYRLLNDAISQVDHLGDIIAALSFYYSSNDLVLRSLLKDFPENLSLSASYQFEISNHLMQLWLNRREIVGISIYIDKIPTVSAQPIGVSTTRFPEEMGWLEMLGNQRGIIISRGDTYRRGSGNPFNMLSIIKILDDDDSVLGYLSFEISEEFLFQEILSTSKASQSSVIFMEGKDSIIVSHEDKNILGKKSCDIYPFLCQDLAEPLNGQIVSHSGVRCMLVASSLGNLGIRAYQLIPVREVYNSSVITFVIIFAALGLCVAILFMWLIAVRISRPIVQLSSIMAGEQVWSDKQEAYSSFTNEIGTLHTNYHQMIERIHSLIEQQKESMNIMRRAEINALQAQINPHFMYNSLDYINWQALDCGNPEISNMLTQLSRFLRASLSDSTPVCKLENELTHIKAYLEIFNVRYGRSMSYACQAENSILNALVPKFILQPLVENSIIHGFGRKIDNSRIEISVCRDQDLLRFEVSDNGKGMSAAELQDILEGNHSGTRHQSYGLKNIEERLRFLCGNRYSGLSVKETDIGTCIVFSVPFRTEFDDFGV